MKKETLNKEINFRFYSYRRNKYEWYRITRTLEGWLIRKNINDLVLLKSNRNGEGAIFDVLDNENVFYPKEGISFAFEQLWNEADNGKIGFKELELRLYDVADWISYMERSVRKKQPNWSKFY